ncbi:hypothetical protein A2Z00_05080 [Candidatus Gottesmanbacteria bacterium RBG_13_45_10]|uniref:Uncharacterized protein n=1 Tax=Candidatus Gottesmanbacteria bacterium RBG_13_45_10 TaxID=1798370 RepID=A0A1F5ZGF1_9BACT|nr:MAG: hypothetical protein A2Z00_05080 [Candidatus Gottesmanbacteria bacterium RBG_13_45_10]
MRGIEQQSISPDDPTCIERQIENGIREVVGSHVAFHHTVAMYKATYGGLHQTSEEAEAAFKQMHSQGLDEPLASARLKNKIATTVFLDEGDEYCPWGIGGHVFTHGKNDGFHESTVPEDLRDAAKALDSSFY